LLVAFALLFMLLLFWDALSGVARWIMKLFD
jgi:hypothetical protein